MEQTLSVNAIVHDMMDSVWRVLTTAAQKLRDAPEKSIFRNDFKEAAEYDIAANEVHADAQLILRSRTPDTHRALHRVEALEKKFATVAKQHSEAKQNVILPSTEMMEAQKAITFGQCSAMLGDIKAFILDPTRHY